ncbi:hypothetical protein LY76DRAFT_190963 [Colletotrichum caudatum]|nr:hypothetical protein LY76DRAFT_190963 [Colletotrichum caudatum]
MHRASFYGSRSLPAAADATAPGARHDKLQHCQVPFSSPVQPHLCCSPSIASTYPYGYHSQVYPLNALLVDYFLHTDGKVGSLGVYLAILAIASVVFFNYIALPPFGRLWVPRLIRPSCAPCVCVAPVAYLGH